MHLLKRVESHSAVPLIVISIGLFLFVAWNQSHWWRTDDEDKFGWLTPALVTYVLFDRRGEIAAAWTRCFAEDSPRIRRRYDVVISLVSFLVFVTGLLCFVLGAADRAGGSHSMWASFLVTLGASLSTVTAVWLLAPSTACASRSRIGGDGRIVLVRLMLYPLAVWFFSEPVVTFSETQASALLLKPIAAAVAAAFGLLGYPLSRAGNILVMPDHGLVGVEEACSGIRSFSASIYAGAFLGAVMLKKTWHVLYLIAAATVLAFALNLLRSTFLAGWAYAYGTRSIDGLLHDAAGYGALMMTIVGLFVILKIVRCFERKFQSA